MRCRYRYFKYPFGLIFAIVFIFCTSKFYPPLFLVYYVHSCSHPHENHVNKGIKVKMPGTQSENSLDINFVKLIYPIYLMQMILGTGCVTINGNIVSKITIYQKIYSIIWMILVSASLYHFILMYYFNYYDKDKTLFYTYAFGFGVQYVSYMVNVFRARFYKSEQRVRVFLEIQKVDHDLEKNNLTCLRPGLYFLMLVWIAYIVLSFGGGYWIYVFFNIPKPIYAIPLGCAVLSIYLELVFSGTCICYLAQRLRHLNYIIRSNIVKRKHKSNRKIHQGLSIDFRNADKIVNLKVFTKILTSILKLFHETSALFKSEIFIVVTTTFIWTFLVIESNVIGLKSKLVSKLSSALLSLWIGFYFVQLMTMAYSCDWFAKQVRQTKRLALHALSVYCEDKDANIRKASWELLSLIEFEQPIFSVYGIFNLDMRLPFQLIGVITTNVLVLIQYTSNALNTC